jgi:hypothetical protein
MAGPDDDYGAFAALSGQSDDWRQDGPMRGDWELRLVPVTTPAMLDGHADALGASTHHCWSRDAGIGNHLRARRQARPSTWRRENFLDPKEFLDPENFLNP